jgi:excisionase family DNA binding protein
MVAKLLSVEETAAMLGIAPRTIRNRTSQGNWPIRVIRIGRRTLFSLADVEQFIENGGQS